MTRTIHLDATSPKLTAAERTIVELRNLQASWSDISRLTGKTKTTCRNAWDSACRKTLGAPPPRAELRREDPTIGNEQHMRGVPISGRGVGGAINGSRPGDIDQTTFLPGTNAGRRSRGRRIA